MKILLINGSPHNKGNTFLALDEMRKIFDQENIQVEWIQVGNQPIRGCLGCRVCYRTGKCIIDDVVNRAAGLLEEADGVVVGSPVYFA